jgi:hypothetical protein
MSLLSIWLIFMMRFAERRLSKGPLGDRGKMKVRLGKLRHDAGLGLAEIMIASALAGVLILGLSQYLQCIKQSKFQSGFFGNSIAAAAGSQLPRFFSDFAALHSGRLCSPFEQ